MRALLKRAATSQNAEAQLAFEVIDTFDQLMAEQAPLERLATVASQLSGCEVGIEDTWNGRRLRASPDEGSVRALEQDEPDSLADAVSRAAVKQNLRGRHAAPVKTAVGQVVAASVEVATGRIGIVWLAGRGREWSTLDQLVVERLASATAIDAIREHEVSAMRMTLDPTALEILMTEGRAAEEIVRAARRARLNQDASYVAIGAEEQPQGAASPEAVAQIVRRAIAEVGLTARSTVMGRIALVVSESGPGLEEAFASLAADERRRGFAIRVGIGGSAAPAELGRSWKEAREALVLGSLLGEGDHVAFADLGILHLLAQIPNEEVERFPDVKLISSLNVGDLRVLEVYCATGSLRQTASRIHLHHSSVAYRLKRIEQVLGFSLADPGRRLQALMAVKLAQVSRVLSG